MGPHGHVVHYYVRRGEMVNFVAIHDTDEWTEESWIREADCDELMATYARWNPTLLRLFECSDRYFKWGLFDREPLPRWTKGRVTLLGDSAHAMLPFLAQGAAMGIEDGCVLAELVARLPNNLNEALRRYQSLRVPRTRRAVIGSRETRQAQPPTLALGPREARYRIPGKTDVATRTGGASRCLALWLRHRSGRALRLDDGPGTRVACRGNLPQCMAGIAGGVGRRLAAAVQRRFNAPRQLGQSIAAGHRRASERLRSALSTAVTAVNFRILSLIDPAVDERLAAAGYTREGESCVLYRSDR